MCSEGVANLDPVSSALFLPDPASFFSLSLKPPSLHLAPFALIQCFPSEFGFNFVRDADPHH